LLGEAFDELAARAHGHRGNIVDRLVRVELGALAADLRQRIDEFCAQPEKPELKDLEEPDGPCADDDGVGDGGELAALSGQ
jgi:hypothetical protein